MARRVYVDIDDVVSDTIERLVDLLELRHGRRVDIEDVAHFDLERSFGLDSEEIASLMEEAHSDAVIESLEPTEGAALVLGHWKRGGDRIDFVTGRPPTTHAASRRWLADRGIDHDGLHHLDKWGRWGPVAAARPIVRFEELTDFAFDFAVEDSLDTAVRLVEALDVPVALMDRPWNRSLERVAPEVRAKLVRCRGWEQVATAFVRR